MPSGIPIDGKSFVGHVFNGIEIIDVYRTGSGKWGAQVRCSCGRIAKMSLRRARGLSCCTHRKKEMRGRDD